MTQITPKIPVMILCGGMGTRLREETEYLPKPMVPIGGRPILWHIMKGFAAYGCVDFVLCLGYKGEKIREYFLNYHAINTDFTIDLGRNGGLQFHDGHHESGWRVTLADTGIDSMTGARVARAARYISGDRFFLTYGDGVANVNIADLVRHHEASGAVGTVTGITPSSRFGEIVADDHRVRSFSEKPRMHEGLINGGFFLFERKFFDYVSVDAGCILEREPLERLVVDGGLSVFKHQGFWQCMDTYRDYQLLEQLWQSGEAHWKVW